MYREVRTYFRTQEVTFMFSRRVCRQAGSGFDPFATAFSRKSRTHLQERAERGLAHLSESQARRQQRFSNLEERNITILLPLAKLAPPQETRVSSRGSIETEEEEEGSELELVAQLWRERMSHDEVERFETAAAKRLRLLRTAKVYPYVVLRVRLPGGVYLQGRFNLEETLEVRDRDKLCSPRSTQLAMLTVCKEAIGFNTLVNFGLKY